MCWTVQRVELPVDLRHHSSFVALLKELGMGWGAVFYKHGAPSGALPKSAEEAAHDPVCL